MIDIVFERDTELFLDGWKALDFARSIKNCASNEVTNFHYYWRVPKEFGPKQATAIKSCIATQDLLNDKVVINVWSNVDLSNSEHMIPLLPYIVLRKYDPVEEAKGTILEGRTDLLTGSDNECFVDGDLFRILILYKYGGVYCDCDTILLRNFAPLLDNEFVYQWGTEKDQMNGAIMRCKAKSKFALEMMIEIYESEWVPCGSVGWGSQLYRKVRDKFDEFTVFPSIFFNSEWQVGHNMGESHHPMRKHEQEVELFDGAFAWHWHNKWDDVVEDGSKFDIMSKIVDRKFYLMKEYCVDVTIPHGGGNIRGGDNATFVPGLWKWLIEKFHIKSMLDIGCAEGHAVSWFDSNGVISHGIDCVKKNIDRAPESCKLFDLCDGSYIVGSGVDLVWCCEVAEHIHEDYVENLIDTCCNGKVVAFTFSNDSTAGYNHVNCKNLQYWVKKFESKGYILNAGMTEESKKYGHGHWNNSGVIFQKIS